MAHAQKPDLVFQRNGRIHLNQWVSVQSTTGSRGVPISGQQLYRPCSDVQCKAAGYPLHLVFQRNGPVHLNRRGRQFSRLLAAEVCASAVVMLDTPCSEVYNNIIIECKTTGYPLHSHVSPSLSLPCVTVCHQVSTELYPNLAATSPHPQGRRSHECPFSTSAATLRHITNTGIPDLIRSFPKASMQQVFSSESE